MAFKFSIWGVQRYAFLIEAFEFNTIFVKFEIFIQISAILEVLMNALLENLGKYNSCVRILVTFEFIIWRVLGYNVLI